MILLSKAVLLEMGVQGVQAHLQKFWFAENLGKIPENPGKMAPNVAWLQKIASKACRKTHEDLFWRSHQKKVLIFVGEKLQVKLHK